MNANYHMRCTIWIDESAVDNRSRRRCAAGLHRLARDALSLMLFASRWQELRVLSARDAGCGDAWRRTARHALLSAWHV